MAVRNCADIGENLQKIMARLLANDDLVKYLYYTDKEPLNHPVINEPDKKTKVYNELIRIIPRMLPRENAQSLIIIRVDNGIKINSNNEFKTVGISIEVFVPLNQWLIKDTNLRPFVILGEIQKSLEGKTINGLGKMEGGDFELTMLTDEMSCYTAHYSIISYE